jgi:hypothetical protein
MKDLLTTLVIAAAVMIAAPDKPDFSGKWKLDLRRSDFGAIPQPESMTRAVEQNATAISVEQISTGPEMNVNLKYSTDGKETSNSFMGTDYKSQAGWEGRTLVIHNIVGGGDGSSVDKWTLSDDGKTFTDVLNITTPGGDFVITHVFVRQ